MKFISTLIALSAITSVCSAQYYKAPGTDTEEFKYPNREDQDYHLQRVGKPKPPKWTIKLDDSPTDFTTLDYVAVLGYLEEDEFRIETIPLPDMPSFTDFKAISNSMKQAQNAGKKGSKTVKEAKDYNPDQDNSSQNNSANQSLFTPETPGYVTHDGKTSDSFVHAQKTITVLPDSQLEMFDDHAFIWNNEAGELTHYTFEWEVVEKELPPIQVEEDTVIDMSGPEYELVVNESARIPLQFDELYDFALIEDSLYAYGKLGSDIFVAVTTLSDMSPDSSWIIPGPLPENRMHAALIPIDQRLYLVGGHTTNNDRPVDYRRMLYSELTLPTDMSSYSQFFNPQPDASRFGHAIELHDMIVFAGDTEENDVRRFHMISRTDGPRMGKWTRYTYEPYGDLIEVSANPNTNQIVLLEKSKTDESHILSGYTMPKSFQLNRMGGQKMREVAKPKFTYVSLRAALKRAAEDEGSVLVVTESATDEMMKIAEKVFRSKDGSVMLENVIVSQIYDRDQEKFGTISENMEAVPPFILLNFQEQVISTSEQITNRQEMYDFLVPLWQPKQSS